MAKASERSKSRSSRGSGNAGGRRKTERTAGEAADSRVALANGQGEPGGGVVEDNPGGHDAQSAIDAETHAKYEEVKRGDLHIKDLQKLNVDGLHEIAKTEGLTDYTGLTKSELIFNRDKCSRAWLILFSNRLIISVGWCRVKMPVFSS